MTFTLWLLGTILAEVVLGLVFEAWIEPVSPTLNRLLERSTRIWWIDLALRPRTFVPPAVGCLLGIGIMGLGWLLMTRANAPVGLVLFVLGPIPALSLLATWRRSPFRRSASANRR